ncbi:MAG: FAD-binding protein [Parcubacteria group bacterium]|nr:FAD-binding protein [Parcubacteria group bacterium]
MQKTDTVIIGAGFSGLYLSKMLLSLDYDKFLIVAPDRRTASDKSYYNFRSRGVRQDSLKHSMVVTGKHENNFQLVNVMVNNIDDELTYLDSITRLKPSFMGAQIVHPQSFLIELKETSKNHRIYEEVESIKKKGNSFIVKVSGSDILSKRLVFCSGGNRADLSEAFNDEKVWSNAFELANSIGCETKMLDKVMLHPFYSKGVCIPSDNLVDFTVVDESGDELSKTNALLRAHNAHHRFDEILQEFGSKRCFAVRGNKTIELTPQVHYRLGGVKINKHGQTNRRNVYALGECSFGMHGSDRIGGCALSEILVMARVIGTKLAVI